MDNNYKTYDAHLDSKKRITIRNSKYEYYHVTEYENGVIVLEPRKLVDPLTISKKTLKEIDESMANIKKGKAYGPIKVSE